MMRTAFLLTMALLLAACAGVTGQVGKWNCNDGLCIAAEILDLPPAPQESQPVLTLLVEVQSERDISELGVSLYYSLPGWATNEGTPESTSMMREMLLEENGVGWWTEIKAGEVLRVVQKVRLLQPNAQIDIYASASTKQGLRTVKVLSVEFTPEKIVIDPTPVPYDGTPPLAPTVPPEKVATFEARLTQQALLTSTQAFVSPLTTPTPPFVSPLPTPAPVAP
ncbi:MAG: hypothetical protein NZ553_10985 [Caldilinea sp.]|nr:hypothetical protein [Caldilinea sp.]MDW8440988.1 hypothetical protein [Caldilineaceae bacterium]